MEADSLMFAQYVANDRKRLEAMVKDPIVQEAAENCGFTVRASVWSGREVRREGKDGGKGRTR